MRLRTARSTVLLVLLVQLLLPVRAHAGPPPAWMMRSEVHAGQASTVPVTGSVEPVERVARPVWPRLGTVQERLVAAWPGDDEWMLRTVRCESDFDPDMWWKGGCSGTGCAGLFSFGGWARANYGDPRNQSVEEQARSAWALLVAEGSSQWSCSPWSYRP